MVIEPASATTLAQLKELTADVIGGTNSQLVGKLHAQYADGEFSYRLEWTGGNADVQEAGWTFEMPADCDHFSMGPETPAGRCIRRRTYAVSPPAPRCRTRRMFTLTRGWIARTHSISTPPNTIATEAQPHVTKAGAGLRAEFDPHQRFHCRGGLGNRGQGYALFVNQQVSPPDDISKNVAGGFSI